MSFEGKKVLVWGNEESGKACNKILRENGAIVTMISIQDEKCFQFSEHYDFVLLSPGVPVLQNQNLSVLVQNGAKILGEAELGFMFSKSKIFGITGTNGKTTTTTLLSNIFSLDGKNTFLCGNIGVPFSLVAPSTNSQSFVCLELSSYQLETAVDLHVHVACMLNIAPDHLTRHKSMSNYIKAKRNIFLNQTKTDFAVLNAGDLEVVAMEKHVNSNIIWFCSQFECDGAYQKDGYIYYKNEKIVSLNKIKLLGAKNLENVLAAVAIAKTQNINNNIIAKAISQFKPLRHRIQKVGTINGVSFINDSKATNVASTLTALKAVKQNLILLLGGSDKGEDFSALRSGLGSNVKFVVVYGATKQKILNDIKNCVKPYCLFEAYNLEKAFFLAANIAKRGDAVLLSPACASFDEFNNYEQRGDVFCQLVEVWRNK